MNSPTRDTTFRQVVIEDNLTTYTKDSSPFNFFKKYIEKGSINECVINLCIISVGVVLLALSDFSPHPYYNNNLCHYKLLDFYCFRRRSKKA